MKSIVHKDLYSLLALELKDDGERIRKALLHDATSFFPIMEKLEASDFAQMDLALAEPLKKGKDGPPLLTANSKLTSSYIRSLLTRQLQDENSVIGPIILTPSDQLIAHYKTKITSKIDGLLTQLREEGTESSKLIHGVISKNSKLACLKEYFNEFVANALKGGDAVPIMIDILGSSNGDDMLKSSITASFVSMAVLSFHPELNGRKAKKDQISNLGMAALFQDVSRILTPDLPENGHEDESSQILTEFGVDNEVLEAARLHHCITDPEGNPALKNTDFLPLHVRVLVACNIFLSMVKEGQRIRNFETMKNFNHLAIEKYIDKESAKILSKMYVPKVKAFIVEKANQIAKLCQQEESRAILWPVMGDKLPTIFICNAQNCRNRSQQMSQLAKNVDISIEGFLNVSIGKGTYFTCSLLTTRLKALYDFIQTRLDQTGGKD